MNIAAQLSAPPRGANAHSVAEANARGRGRLLTWREDRLPRPAIEQLLIDRARTRRAEERFQRLDVCNIDHSGEVALEHRRWMQATGQSPFDLYVMIEGHEPPTHLTPDDIFALIVCAHLSVRRSSS